MDLQGSRHTEGTLRVGSGAWECLSAGCSRSLFTLTRDDGPPQNMCLKWTTETQRWGWGLCRGGRNGAPAMDTQLQSHGVP